MIRAIIIVSVFALISVFQSTFAEEKTDQEEEEVKTVEEFIDGFKKMDGLFSIYHDEKTGALYMQLDASNIGQEYIYHHCCPVN